jgi:hypothetical protein
MWQATISWRDDDYKNIGYGSETFPVRPTEEEAWEDVFDYAKDRMEEYVDCRTSENLMGELKEFKKLKIPSDFLVGDDWEPNTEDYTVEELVGWINKITRRGQYCRNLWEYSVSEIVVQSRKKRKTEESN